MYRNTCCVCRHLLCVVTPAVCGESLLCAESTYFVLGAPTVCREHLLCARCCTGRVSVLLNQHLLRFSFSVEFSDRNLITS